MPANSARAKVVRITDPCEVCEGNIQGDRLGRWKAEVARPLAHVDVDLQKTGLSKLSSIPTTWMAYLREEQCPVGLIMLLPSQTKSKNVSGVDGGSRIDVCPGLEHGGLTSS